MIGKRREAGHVRTGASGRRCISLFILAVCATAGFTSGHEGSITQAGGSAPSTPRFKVGVARCDITPEQPMPMWGYGGRHDRLSEGVLDRLHAKALVIEAGNQKLAIVGLDLGRGPTPAMMERIRLAATVRGIGQVLICGSHTHHGPVIELSDQPGFGKGKFDAAVAYARVLPDQIIAVIREADDNRREARMGVAFRDLQLNRNRQTKRPEHPTDPRLTVIRFDDANRMPIAVLGALHGPSGSHPGRGPQVLCRLSGPSPKSRGTRAESPLRLHPGRQPAIRAPTRRKASAIPGPMVSSWPGIRGTGPEHRNIFTRSPLAGCHRRPFPVPQPGELQERPHVHALREGVLSRAGPELRPRTGRRSQPRAEHGRAQPRPGNRGISRRAVQPACRAPSPPRRSLVRARLRLLQRPLSSTFPPSKRPRRGATAPTQPSLRSRSARGGHDEPSLINIYRMLGKFTNEP